MNFQFARIVVDIVGNESSAPNRWLSRARARVLNRIRAHRFDCHFNRRVDTRVCRGTRKSAIRINGAVDRSRGIRWIGRSFQFSRREIARTAVNYNPIESAISIAPFFAIFRLPMFTNRSFYPLIKILPPYLNSTNPIINILFSLRVIFVDTFAY